MHTLKVFVYIRLTYKHTSIIGCYMCLLNWLCTCSCEESSNPKLTPTLSTPLNYWQSFHHQHVNFSDVVFQFFIFFLVHSIVVFLIIVNMNPFNSKLTIYVSYDNIATSPYVNFVITNLTIN
jgi:hypothetical protein